MNQTSQRFWLTGIAFSIACGLSKTARLAKDIQKLKTGTSEKAVVDEVDRKVQMKTIAKYVFREG